MMRMRFSYFAALSAVLGGAALFATISWRGGGATSGNGGIAAVESGSGPEILLQGVDMREIRKGEAPNRFLSEHAAYRVLTGDFTASDVTLMLPGRLGGVVVRAPEARWDMPGGRITLPAGGSAESGGGWRASVATATLSLGERVLNSQGEVHLSGPGLAVAGDNLTWRWRDGKVEIERPKSRVMPARALGKRG